MKTNKKHKNSQRLRRIIKENDINSQVFKIKKFVDSLDYTKMEEKIFKKSNYGQHIIPLRTAFGIWLYAYSQGEQSYRKVAKKCQTDDYYYFLSEGFMPSPAYLEHKRLVLFPFIQEIFEENTKKLIELGIIDNDLIGLDGVKFQVWASSRQSKTENSINKEQEKINAMLTDTKDEKERNRLKNRYNKLYNRKKELQKRKEDANNLSQKDKDKMKINITSPETRIMYKNGRFFQAINIQMIVSLAQYINLITITSKVNDSGLLLKMYNKLCNFLNSTILTIHLLADCGYWKEKDLIALDPDIGYKIIIPSIDIVKKERKRNTRQTGYDISYFRYNKKADVLICPMNNKLTFRRIVNLKTNYCNYRVYQSKGCNDCPLKKKCIGKANLTYKKLTIREENPVVKKYKEQYNNPENKELYKKRKVINEPVHGQMFHNNNIYTLHCINYDVITGEVYLLGLIHNLKKAWKAGWNQPKNIFFYVFIWMLEFLLEFEVLLKYRGEVE